MYYFRISMVCTTNWVKQRFIKTKSGSQSFSTHVPQTPIRRNSRTSWEFFKLRTFNFGTFLRKYCQNVTPIIFDLHFASKFRSGVDLNWSGINLTQNYFSNHDTGRPCLNSVKNSKTEQKKKIRFDF